MQGSAESLHGAFDSGGLEDRFKEAKSSIAEPTKDLKYEWREAQSLLFTELKIQGVLALLS